MNTHSQRPEPEDPYPNVPTAMVFDTFAETASRLTGAYVARMDAAATKHEGEEWWKKVMTLRNTKRAVPAYDRAQLIAHIRLWAAELAELQGERG